MVNLVVSFLKPCFILTVSVSQPTPNLIKFHKLNFIFIKVCKYNMPFVLLSITLLNLFILGGIYVYY